jgi:hypothetical protein
MSIEETAQRQECFCQELHRTFWQGGTFSQGCFVSSRPTGVPCSSPTHTHTHTHTHTRKCQHPFLTKFGRMVFSKAPYKNICKDAKDSHRGEGYSPANGARH